MLMITPSTKREIRKFHVIVVQRRQRNAQKNVMHVRAKLLFCQFKPIAFLPFSRPPLILGSGYNLIPNAFLLETGKGKALGTRLGLDTLLLSPIT